MFAVSKNQLKISCYRKGSLEMNLESMKTNLKNLSDTLVKKQTSISNLSQLLDEETKKNMNLNPKLDAIK